MNSMIRSMILLLITGTVLLFPRGRAYAQEVSVSNVSYTTLDSNIVVRYDLSGPPSKSFRVQLVLRRRSTPSFKMTPHDVLGDIGTNQRTGKNKEIIWRFFKDAPYGLDGNDYYFQVTATLLSEKKGGPTWLYYVGGAIIVGAAAVYLGPSVFNGSTGGHSLPAPPLRP